MLRGYQKRVIYLKNTGSEIFKEAYFVLEDEKRVSSSSKKALVDEANKIIDENFYFKKNKKFIKIIPYVCFIGGMITASVMFLIYLFFR